MKANSSSLLNRMSGFQGLVEQGLKKGLSASAAEQWARDRLYGGLEDEEPDDGLRALDRFASMEDDSVRLAPEDAPQFASVDELWASLQRAWEQRDKGVELVDVLEEVNDLLDRGVISAEQFRDLLVRAEEMRTSAGRTAYKSGTSKVAPGPASSATVTAIGSQMQARAAFSMRRSSIRRRMKVESLGAPPPELSDTSASTTGPARWACA